MFDALRRLFNREKKLPKIEVTGFRHGLLTFRSDDPLSLKEITVETPTPAGNLQTRMDIQSYDPQRGEYLAKLAPDDKTLESLDIDISKIASVQKVLKVSSPSLPAYMGLTEELSPSGMLLSTTEPLPEGAVLELTIDFDLVALGKLKVKAKVEWSAHKGDGTCHSGLRFQNPNSTVIRKMAHFIQLTRQCQSR